MNPSDYPSNSNKAKTAKAQASAPQEKRVKKVVTSPVIIKEKTKAQKFLGNFIAKDASDIKEYLVQEVLIPTVKDTIWAAITNTVEMTLWGGTGRARRSGTSNLGSRVRNFTDYCTISSKDTRRYNDRYDDEPRSVGFDPEDIVFRTLTDAEAVLDQMAACIEQWDKVSVNELYDMVGRTAPSHTATRYGWTYLDAGCKPVRVRDGYILKLPKARPLTGY